MSDYWFTCLSHEDALKYWGHIEPLLEKALAESHGERDLGDIVDAIEQRLMYIAVMGRGDKIVLCLAMETINYPQYSVLSLSYVAGRDVRVFFDKFRHIIIAFARDIGCRAVQFSCSDAHERLYRRFTEMESVHRTLRIKV